MSSKRPRTQNKEEDAKDLSSDGKQGGDLVLVTVNEGGDTRIEHFVNSEFAKRVFQGLARLAKAESDHTIWLVEAISYFDDNYFELPQDFKEREDACKEIGVTLDELKKGLKRSNLRSDTPDPKRWTEETVNILSSPAQVFLVRI
jgi:hypothetical protein